MNPTGFGLDSTSTWRPVGLVAGREITTRLRSKAYRVLTAITAVVILGLLVAFHFINASGPSTDNVGVTSPALAAPLQANARAAGINVVTHAVTDEAAGTAQVDSGSLDALVLLNPDGSLSVVVKKSVDSGLQAAANATAREVALDEQIVHLGGDPATVDRAVATASVRVRTLQPVEHYNTQGIAIGIAAGALIYITLLTLGQMVAQGVVEEKSSRVVELLLATVRPWQLMAGKVLGIGVVGLIQIVIYGGVGLIAGGVLGVLPNLAGAAAGVIGLVVWYILGFLMYALAFAAAGALVSRQEDAAGVVTPILMFVVAGWVVGVSLVPSNPNNPIAVVMSLIPTFSPTLMPIRIAMGAVPFWQYGLAVVLTLAVIPGLLWLSGRIYRNGVLRTGVRVKLSEALRAA
ncbi:MAG TPA: ABC transporter permease [Pseudonocardiaceae bacterium]|jgi:ABC-2 type transport system permease protein|nr:ABC transporter permease [Pseudonocardiaceae bacterium]